MQGAGPVGMLPPMAPSPNYIDAGQQNATLYVQNLNEKVTLAHLVPQLRETFAPFGELVDVVAKRRLALRGQAFVQYKEVEAARTALEALQGERLYGKSMVIKYAKYKSDLVSKADGTYEIERRRREQDRSTPAGVFSDGLVERSRQPRMTRRQMLAQMTASPGMQGTMNLPMPGLSMPFPGAGPAPMLAPQMVGGELQIPSKVLYLQSLPSGTTEAQLSALFARFPGFNEIRLVSNRPDVAFAEYESEMQAIVARQGVDGHEIQPGLRLRVSFARR